jgi:hypothetical protein
VVDDRAFLLGLDGLYREAMKRHERGELLACARKTALVLGVTPTQRPIEGYYTEDESLTAYFLLMRALQDVPKDRSPEVTGLPEFQRLRDVTSSPLFGRASGAERLLPPGRDALSETLRIAWPDWTIAHLTAGAAAVAKAWDDFSLVGLAARIGDPVVLAALRESVVLYAELVFGAARGKGEPEYVWAVDPELVTHAERFIATFKSLFGDELPAPTAENAAVYWHGAEEILGRCVRLGIDATGTRHYHWAIRRGPTGSEEVQEFWAGEIWTTERYRAGLERGEFPPM